MIDPINPSHYRLHPSGVECITIAREFSFCLGNVIKYVWRAGVKTADPLQDLRKAKRYLDEEISRLEAQAKTVPDPTPPIGPPPFVNPCAGVVGTGNAGKKNRTPTPKNSLTTRHLWRMMVLQKRRAARNAR